MANNCYFDIAKIIARYDPALANQTCEDIYQRRSTGNAQPVNTELLGGVVNVEVCKDDASRMYQTSPQNYWGKSDNLCAIVYVLPLLLITCSLRIRVRP